MALFNFNKKRLFNSIKGIIIPKMQEGATGKFFNHLKRRVISLIKRNQDDKQDRVILNEKLVLFKCSTKYAAKHK